MGERAEGGRGPAVKPSTKSGDASSDVRWWQIVLGLVLIAGICGAVWFIARAAFRTFTALPQSTSAAIVTASATVLVAVGTVLTSRYFERRATAEQEQRNKRIPVYEDFVKGLLDLIGATRPPDKRKAPSVDEIYAHFGKFTEQLVIWGSDEVIRAWVEYRTASTLADQDDPKAVLSRLEGILLALRKDLGMKSKKLEQGDLLRLWVTNLETDGA